MMMPIMAANADESGTFGENLTWSYVESTNTLTISGSGSMPDCFYSNYSNYYYQPWSYSSTIQKVVIEEGVTSIGRGYFEKCPNLTSITIPKSVTSIGGGSFSQCSSLTSVYITDLSSWCSVKFDANPLTKAHHLFLNGKELTDLVIPDGVLSISNSAFSGCTELISVTIPNSVTSIGSYAFLNCTGLTTITLPNSVTSIGSYSFQNCNGITSMLIKSSPTTIGDSPFSGCTNIKNVSFDCETITKLFSGISSIERIDLSDKVKNIGEYAFSGCSNLTFITIPKNVITVGNYAFQKCSGLTSIIIPNSVTTIGNHAFEYCNGLISVIIGSSVISIGSDAFWFTNLKKTIWLTNTPPSGYSYASGSVNYVSNDQFSSLRNIVKYQFLSSYFDVDGVRYVPISLSERTCDAIDCIYGESAKDTKIASTVAYKGITMNVININSYLAYGNKYIETLSVDTKGMLASYAFADCSNLKSVIYGNKVTGLGDHVFSGCSSLTSIKTTDNISQDNVLFISKNISNIEDFAVSGCSEIKNVIMADSDTELRIGSNGKNPLFSLCPLDYVYIGRNINYGTNSNCGYSPFYRNTTLSEVKITDKETEISENEFYGCTNLRSITIGDGVTTIGNRAFSGCQSLKSFSFGSQVATIGQEAFSDCSAITEIISKAQTPPICETQALDDINKWECKLYVPVGCLSTYGTAPQWKDFIFKEEADGTAEEQTENKCAKPTIVFANGKLLFNCETEGATCHYTITSDDLKSGIVAELTMNMKYKVSVYSSKAGYQDSETAISEILITEGGKAVIKGDANSDGVVNKSDISTISDIIMKK